MGLNDDLVAQCDRIFQPPWKRRNGTVVPTDSSITFANDGVDLEGAVLYADLTGSTKLVDSKNETFAAEIYKAFLYTSARIVGSHGGEITAYDGDRIMAVFLGAGRTAAVMAALKINWAVRHIIQPRMQAAYKASEYVVSHTCGVDWSRMMVAKTGVRGANDLVWVGRAANHAAKLCEIRDPASTWITAEVYNGMNDAAKFNGIPKQNMWKPRSWTQMGNQLVYASTWEWPVA
jgi:class 3 adenylate cyclase